MFVDKNENVCSVSCFSGGQTLRPVKPWSREEGYVGESREDWRQNGDNKLEAVEMVEEEKGKKGSSALDTTKHLWASIVAAMVSRFYFLIVGKNGHEDNDG
ncbi:hypothetical protein GOBAR_DD30654 [Gossypium barbadense]|nr:hypothetical protein GOBAR_DD30654 [Gossypium barbadense]